MPKGNLQAWAHVIYGCRQTKAPFTFIMQIMFGSPSLSLTFSWAAPPRSRARSEGLSRPVSGFAANSGLEADSEAALDETELLGKPFELTLARLEAR